MMPDLDAVVIFAAVAERGGFGAAAAALGVPKATVSRKVAALEERLGARLLQRTTRRVALTEFGRRYLGHCRRIVEELRAAEASVAATRAEPSGLVRLTAPVLVAQTFLGPILSDFAAVHPGVRFEIDVTNRRVDLIEEGFDLAIRVGPLPASTLVVRRLGRGSDGLYATPAYLAAKGVPREPGELGSHALVDGGPLRAAGVPARWMLRCGGDVREVAAPPTVAANDARLALAFALSGRGVARLPTFVAAPHVLDGTLAAVLPEWTANEVDLVAVFPSHKGLVPAVRALVDFLADRLAARLALV